MKFSNVRLLVKDFAKCFKFYSEQLGLEPAWGDENSGYAYYRALKEKGVIFVNEPTDMVDWGSRTVLLRDPEDNLIELFSPLAPEQWSEELIEENKKYE